MGLGLEEWLDVSTGPGGANRERLRGGVIKVKTPSMRTDRNDWPSLCVSTQESCPLSTFVQVSPCVPVSPDMPRELFSSENQEVFIKIGFLVVLSDFGNIQDRGVD